MDKSLDEIISTNKSSRLSSRRPRRSTGRSQVLGTTMTSPSQRVRAAASKVVAPATPNTADKIIVSNLPTDVNEAQVKELFTSTVGLTKTVMMHYDANGHSKGIASVTFQKKGDGNKAYQKYHNRLIDGQRPMKIEIVVDPSRPLPLTSRLAPPPVNGTKPAKRVVGRVKRRGKKTERPQKSAADLDAEMEDYTASNAPATTAAATA